jgi:hypothetical protein
LRTAATLAASLALIGGAAALAPRLAARNPAVRIERADSITPYNGTVSSNATAIEYAYPGGGATLDTRLKAVGNLPAGTQVHIQCYLTATTPATSANGQRSDSSDPYWDQIDATASGMPTQVPAGSVTVVPDAFLKIPVNQTVPACAGTAGSTTGNAPASNGNPAPPANPPGNTGGSTTGRAFQGIFAFSGGNTADLASNPDVAGRSLVYYWAQLEPQPGVYRWDLIDRDMQPWVAAGKKVILRVSAAGWASWDKAADSAHGTPAWVYARGVKSVTEKDGAVMPQYWSPAFLKNLNDFLTAFAARYDGNPHVTAVDIAVGVGGETKPDSESNPQLLSLWQAVGYTDPVWWNTVTQIITDYTQAFRKTPLAIMPDKTFLGGTSGYNESKTVAYAVSKGLWLQDNGLIPGRTLSPPWGQTPLISEQRGQTSQTGDSLAADLQAAMNDHATLILVFTSDLTPANSAVIHQLASQTRQSSPGRSSNTSSSGQ